MYDLIVKNGVVVDGLGGPRRKVDIAVFDGCIVAVGEVTGDAARTIDAAGLIVAPGFVDPHTHYDAQLSWDRFLTPSIWHGVTSVVVGNCGVGIAPCRSDDKSREIATQDLVLVEQIPYEVLQQGIAWRWESFADFMGATEDAGCALNVGFIAPLTPFRHFVMGEDSLHRAATVEETASIKGMIKEAVEAGALGFSTTTLPNHLGYEGLPLACQQASREELAAYCNGLKELGKGCVEIAVSSAGIVTDKEMALLDLVTRESERPVTWLALLERNDIPDQCQEALRMTEQFSAKGAVPQVSARPLTLNIDMNNPTLLQFDIPSWAQTKGLSDVELVKVYADPAFRCDFRADLTKKPYLFSAQWELMVVHTALEPAIEPLVGQTVAAIAAERNSDPLDTFLDLAIEFGVDLTYNYEALNTQEDRVAKLITDPRTMIGISDAGAHVDMLCDASYTTYLLGHWVREKQALSLEHAIQRITSEPADFFGLADRGRIQVGAAADLVVFDAETVGSPRRPTEMLADLPAGGARLVTRANGVHHTVVNGQVVYTNGEVTGLLAGQVLRPN